MKANISKINRALKTLEAQRTIIQNSAKAKIAKTVTKTVTKAIPEATLNYSTIVYKAMYNVLKSLFNIWFERMNKFWIFRVLFKIFSIVFYPIFKLAKIITILKYGRLLLGLLLFLLGLNIDIDSFWLVVPIFSWEWFYGFTWLSIVGFFMTVTEKLYNFLSGVYNRDRFIKAINDKIVVENKFDQEIVSDEITPQQDFINSKNKLFEVTNLKDIDNQPWYSKKWVWAVGGLVLLVVVGGTVYYFYGNRNNQPEIIFDADELAPQGGETPVQAPTNLPAHPMDTYEDIHSGFDERSSSPLGNDPEYNTYFPRITGESSTSTTPTSPSTSETPSSPSSSANSTPKQFVGEFSPGDTLNKKKQTT